MACKYNLPIPKENTIVEPIVTLHVTLKGTFTTRVIVHRLTSQHKSWHCFNFQQWCQYERTLMNWQPQPNLKLIPIVPDTKSIFWSVLGRRGISQRLLSVSKTNYTTAYSWLWYTMHITQKKTVSEKNIQWDFHLQEKKWSIIRGQVYINFKGN